jgi:hypothetical protein
MLLAQTDISTVGGQFEVLIERIVTPGGIVAAIAGAGLVAVLFANSRGLELLSALIVSTMLIPPNFSSVFGLSNVLIGPFQLFRNLSRPIAYAVLAIAALRVILVPPLSGRSALSWTAVSFLLFQCVFSTEVAVFEDFPKGVLGLFSIATMFFVFNVGFGRLMTDRASACRAISLIAWMSTCFIAVNLIQFAFGFGAAFVGGRLAGTAGNAQYMGFLCAVLMLTNFYLLLEPESKPVPRVVLLGNIVFLGAFLVATGSRGSSIASIAGVVLLYRLRLGRLLGVAIVGVLAVWVSALFGDQSTGGTRLLEAADTRTAVWALALREFYDSPIIGNLPVYGEERASSGVESSMLRALASMGIIGGVLLLVPAVLSIRDAIRSLRAARVRPGLPDFHLALTGTLLLVNIYEGVAFGVLSFPVMLAYLCFAIGSYVQAESEEDVQLATLAETSDDVPAHSVEVPST